MPRFPKRLDRGVTVDLIRSALAAIPPDVERDTWVRVGMAVKASDLAESVAFDLWDEWSQKGASYKAADAKSAWRSLKAGGKTTVATLFGIAQDHGWQFPEQPPGDAPARDPSAAECLAEERRAKQAEQEAAFRARADQAARDARRLWSEAIEDWKGEAYPERKGVGRHGVRFLADGTMLVPMRDAGGELLNVQRIAPRKPDDGPDKRFMPGSRKKGLWHALGVLDGASVILEAEGYATAATLHEATGRPAVVAFDAGNLVHVARELRALYPAATILVCGDDDHETEARTGTNGGRKGAATAARAVAAPGAPAGAVFPRGLPPGGSDFNDLGRHAGLDVVRAQVEAAAAAPMVPPPQRRQPGQPGPGGEPPAPPAEGERAGPDRFGFSVDEHGVWHSKRDADGWGKRMWLCAPLRVTARTRTDDANGWGYLLEFADFDGNAKTWAMPSALLSGEGAEWAARLRDMGLDMAVGSGVRTLVATFINTRGPAERVNCTDKVGWHGDVYVLPSTAIAPDGGRRFVFQSDGAVEDTFRVRGTLKDWQDEVAAICHGNSRLVFAICCALAGPVLFFSGLEGGGFHLKGDSRGGKTTALRAAASVYGRENYMQQWRTTANALETTAVQHNHALLILDELGQLDPREAGDTAYLLANGMDKNRATRSLIARRRRTWLLLFLSSGEVGIGDLMSDAGKRVRAGQEVRMVDIPLDAGQGMGGLEWIHEFGSPAELAEAVKDRSRRFYGSCGRAWLQWLVDHFRELPDLVRAETERHRVAFVPEGCSGQVRTVGSRFALVAAAGEIASRVGITSWPPGEAARSARACFEAWLAARGHVENSEQVAMFRQVRAFLEKNGDALFTWMHRAMDDHRPKTALQAGFKRMVDEDGKVLRVDSATDYVERRAPPEASERNGALIEYLVLPEAWRNDVCRGFDAQRVAAVLREMGHLKCDAGKLTSRQRLPGMTDRAPCYIVLPSLFERD